MRHALSRLLLGAVLLSASVAVARDVKEFTGSASTAAKKKGGGAEVNGWNGSDAPAEVKDPPWMAIGLGVIVLLVATPFALRMYRDTSDEVTGARNAGRRASQDDEA
jgi:hypothetical protein